MITKILVANRGEIARRIMATCQRLGISTVGVYTDADADSPHVGDADIAVRLEQVHDYSSVEALLRAAKISGADAVHPGYGFLSENYSFAQAVIDAGLIWIGPDPQTIQIMGSKLEAKNLLQRIGVPVLPMYDPGEITEEHLPVLIKASAGGGGRGMRIVTDHSLINKDVTAARREAESIFGDPTVFCEPYLHAAHHIEVQILADRHQTVWVMGERECSLQRRHQKIIEESPSPLVERIPRMRQQLFDISQSIVDAIGYTGAGTLEFIADSQGQFYFLEMNTRLQVEHPVTEETTGIDLIEKQIDIANGGRLDRSPPPAHGHAIEVRLYAEDPGHDWQPQTGFIHAFEFPHVRSCFTTLDHQPGIRADSSLDGSGIVSMYYDPMLAKLISWAPTRIQAIRLLSQCLRNGKIHGLVTNRDLLVNIMNHPDFIAGNTDTAFLTTHDIQSLSSNSLDSHMLSLALLAAGLADSVLRQTTASVLKTLPAGWRNLGSGMQVKCFRDATQTDHQICYRFDRMGRPLLDGLTVPVLEADRVVLVQDNGLTHRFFIHRYPHTSQIYIDFSSGSLTVELLSRFPQPGTIVEPGSLVAPIPGVVIQLGATIGDVVAAGQPLIWLEAMKMEHIIRAPESGILTTLSVDLGDQVDTGAVLAHIDISEKETLTHD